MITRRPTPPIPIITLTSIGDLVTRHMSNDEDFFRWVEALGIETQRGTRGRAYIVNLSHSEKSLELPANLVYIQRTVMMGTGFTNSSLIVTNGRMEGLIAHALTTGTRPQHTDFPPDKHIRWQSTAPASKNGVYGYLTHGNITIHIPTEEIGEISEDLHAVKTLEGFTIHTLTQSGKVYRQKLPFETVILQALPEFELVQTDVNCLATLHSNNKVKLLVGTDDGLEDDGEILLATKGKKITHVSLDSEAPLLFFVADEQLYCISMTYAGELSHEIMSLGATVKENEQILSGPNTRHGDQGVLIARWEKHENSEDQLRFHHRMINAQLPDRVVLPAKPPA